MRQCPAMDPDEAGGSTATRSVLVKPMAGDSFCARRCSCRKCRFYFAMIVKVHVASIVPPESRKR